MRQFRLGPSRCEKACWGFFFFLEPFPFSGVRLSRSPHQHHHQQQPAPPLNRKPLPRFKCRGWAAALLSLLLLQGSSCSGGWLTLHRARHLCTSATLRVNSHPAKKLPLWALLRHQKQKKHHYLHFLFCQQIACVCRSCSLDILRPPSPPPPFCLIGCRPARLSFSPLGLCVAAAAPGHLSLCTVHPPSAALLH